MKKHILLMDFTSSLNTTGVDRYIESLLSGLSGFQISWLRIKTDRTMMIYQVEKNEKYVKIEIPFPENDSLILGEQYWSKKYFEVVMHILERSIFLHSISLIHLHTLNLIDLAIQIREKSNCKIITHLHCIPWKNYFNTDRFCFNRLYMEYYVRKNYTASLFQSNCNELDAYKSADQLVCLTQCAKKFVQNILNIDDRKICIINNGMKDIMQNDIKKGSDVDGIIRILYVGILSESKGIFTILSGIRKLQEFGYKLELIIAGKSTDLMDRQILLKSKGLNVKLLGRVDFNILGYYYQYSDIGCIASLYEQSSYVAIEMAMFGLPMVVTSVDGLDEMFVDGDNALKVDVTFHPYLGLQINEEKIVASLRQLINNKEFRIKLGAGARKMYEKRFTLHSMISSIESLYNNLI